MHQKRYEKQMGETAMELKERQQHYLDLIEILFTCVCVCVYVEWINP